MQEFFVSFLRFSSALTLYAFQQARNATSGFSKPVSLGRVTDAMDSAAGALRDQIDDSQKTALNSVTTLTTDMLSKTYDTVKKAVPDPGMVLRTTSNVVRRTAETCTSVIT